MKRSAFLTCLLWFLGAISASGQITTYQYGYDGAGNRTGRFIQETLPLRGHSEDSLVAVIPSERRFTGSQQVVSENEPTRIDRVAETVREPQGYSVGGIAITEDTSRSGARIYSVPLPSAPNSPFSPSLSLAYNSQAGEGIAGYGWNIGGLSSISLINRNRYYHDRMQAAKSSDTIPVFALDGEPLVTEGGIINSGAYLYIESDNEIDVHELNRITEMEPSVFYRKGDFGRYTIVDFNVWGLEVSADNQLPDVTVLKLMQTLQNAKALGLYCKEKNLESHVDITCYSIPSEPLCFQLEPSFFSFLKALNIHYIDMDFMN